MIRPKTFGLVGSMDNSICWLFCFISDSDYDITEDKNS